MQIDAIMNLKDAAYGEATTAFGLPMSYIYSAHFLRTARHSVYAKVYAFLVTLKGMKQDVKVMTTVRFAMASAGHLSNESNLELQISPDDQPEQADLVNATIV